MKSPTLFLFFCLIKLTILAQANTDAIAASSYNQRIHKTDGSVNSKITEEPSLTINNAHAQVSTQLGKAQDSSFLTGTFSAVSGTKITLQCNGRNDLTLVAAVDGNKLYSRNNFKFHKAIANGSGYKVTIKSAPAGVGCKIVSNAEGVMPNNAGIKIDCDYNYDLISRTTNNNSYSTFYECSAPVVTGSIAEEGRYVAFVSNAAGFAGATGKHRQIFWRDRNTGETKLISIGADGLEGNGDSFAPSMSTNGHTIAFESYANNLVAGDGNGVRDVFVWDYTSGKIERISVGPGGIEANAESFEPALSGSGGEIAYTSSASNLTDGVESTYTANVYWRQLYSGNQVLVSMDPNTKKGVGGSKPAIAEVGQYVTFCSNASTLVPNDKNGLWDIFLYTSGNPLMKISNTYNGAERNQGTESTSRVVASSISGTGRYVAFATTASNMVANDNNNAQDVFVVDTQNGNVVRASVDAGGKEGNKDSPIEQGEKIAINFDGSWVAFSTRASNLGAPENNILAHNIISGETRAITSLTEGRGVGTPSISLNASYVVFGTGSKIDPRFPSSGIFAAYTLISGSRFMYQNSTTTH
jgi:hypothetical protein